MRYQLSLLISKQDLRPNVLVSFYSSSARSGNHIFAGGAYFWGVLYTLIFGSGVVHDDFLDIPLMPPAADGRVDVVALLDRLALLILDV